MNHFMKLNGLFWALTLLSLCDLAKASEISGAGATFPHPVYLKWSEAYQRSTGVQLSYQSVGSGEGIKLIKAKAVDFAASDMPMDSGELAKEGLVQWPMVMGGVVPVINIRGIRPGDMQLSGPVLADIFLGEIERWDDPQVTRLNPGLKLPSESIAVIHRSDSSGTSFLFTNYLSKVSRDWKSKVGFSTLVRWPIGVGAIGNEGVSKTTAQTPNSIGYVEYAFALQNHLAYTLLLNREGRYIKPDHTSFQSAAANAEWQSPSFYSVLTDQPGKFSWPITGASYILMHRWQANPNLAAEVLKFFKWAFLNGSAMARELDYVPIPREVTGLILDMWEREIKAEDGTPVPWK
jgi:phosphate transport system substrate-binding protein